jgi:hypothetical protein
MLRKERQEVTKKKNSGSALNLRLVHSSCYFSSVRKRILCVQFTCSSDKECLSRCLRYFAGFEVVTAVLQTPKPCDLLRCLCW